MITIQVTLIIRGFEFSRVRKQGKTANSKGNLIKLRIVVFSGT